MSVFFDVDERTVWNPANAVAEVYLRTAAALRDLAGVPTGLGKVRADECAVDPHQLREFTAVLLARRVRTPNHVVLHSLLDGFLATSLVLVERSGLPVEPLNAPGVDAAFWRALMDRQASGMPR